MRVLSPFLTSLCFLGINTVQSFAPVVRHGFQTCLSMSSAEISLDPSETAVVFIEYQNEFTSPGGKLHDAVKDCMEKTSMLDNSVKLAARAREAGCTIIHCPINFEPVRRIDKNVGAIGVSFKDSKCKEGSLFRSF